MNMRKLTLILLVFFALQLHSVNAQPNSEVEILTQKLHEFMAGASVNDKQIHDNFWAEDLIYTSSAGLRFGKAEIMDGFNASQQLQEAAPTMIYTAHDIQVNVYENTAVVAFRMKGETLNTQGSSQAWYLNSGTFLKRDGEWKVVNWQATRIPN